MDLKRGAIVRDLARRNAIALYFMGYFVFYLGFIGRYALDFASVSEFTAGAALGWTLGMTLYTWREFELLRRICLAISLVVVGLCFLACWFAWILAGDNYSSTLILVGVAMTFIAARAVSLMLRGRSDKPWGVARA